MIVEAKTLLTGIVTHLPDLWSKRHDSLSEFTRVTRNDFLTLVENDLITLDYLPDILDTAQTFVSGYYLSAVTLLVDIPEINIRKTLDQVSTKRDPVESILGAGAAAFKYVGTESFSNGLPAINYMSYATVAAECYALEDAKDGQRLLDEQTRRKLDIKKLRIELETRYSKAKIDQDAALDVAKFDSLKQQMDLNERRLAMDASTSRERKELNDAQTKLQSERDEVSEELARKGLDLKQLAQDLAERKFEYEKDRNQTGSVGFGRDAIATIDELSNLSTGKTLEVNFERNGNKASIPVTIRLAVTDTDHESMVAILSASGIKNTFKERWRRMKNGDLAMVKDLLFCHDLLEEARRTRIRDKSGFFEHMMRHQSKNFMSGLFSMNPSINNASAVLIVSEESAKAATVELGGPLSKFSIREKVFKSTAAMLIYVVDTKWDTVTIYHRGIDTFTTVTKRDLQRRKGGGGNDISDIINAYQAGSAPTI